MLVLILSVALNIVATKATTQSHRQARGSLGESMQSEKIAVESLRTGWVLGEQRTPIRFRNIDAPFS